MAVTLRLRRAGSRKKAFFHLVAADSRRSRDGRNIERLGYYNPRATPPVLVVNRARLDYWLGKGATPSETVHNLVATLPAPAPEQAPSV